MQITPLAGPPKKLRFGPQSPALRSTPVLPELPRAGGGARRVALERKIFSGMRKMFPGGAQMGAGWVPGGSLP